MKCCAEIRGNQFHCAVCHRTYGSLALFDDHQDVDYRRDPRIVCRDPESTGLVADGSGTWRTPEDARATTERVAKMNAAKARGKK